MSEKRLIAEQRKLSAMRERIREVAYLKASEVREHLNLSSHALDEIPFAVLPFAPGNGKERVTRRYHPADVEAYPARARRWRNAIVKKMEDKVLAEMEQEIAEQDAKAIGAALEGHAAA